MRTGFICGPARHVESRSVATARQTIMQANTRTRAVIRSSPQPKWVSVGCTAIRTMRSRSIKLWRFVYRSRRLKRFHKCCSHRFAAGRIRPVVQTCPPRRSLAEEGGRSTAALLFYTGKTPHRRSRGAGRAVATEAIHSKLRTQNAACPSIFPYVCCSINFRICGAGIAPA